MNKLITLQQNCLALGSELMHSNFRILITGAGTTVAVTVLKGLRAARDPSLRIIMGDIRRECAGAHLGDEFIHMPAATASDFPVQAEAICREHKIDMVIPIIDYEFIHWRQIADRLAQQGTQVVISPEPALVTCEEKDRSYRYFQSLGIPTVETWQAEEIEDPAKLPFPVYLKPRCGRASLDNYVVQNLAEYRLFMEKITDPIIQPLVA